MWAVEQSCPGCRRCRKLGLQKGSLAADSNTNLAHISLIHAISKSSSLDAQLPVVDALGLVSVIVEPGIVTTSEVIVVVATGGVGVEAPSVVPVALDTAPEDVPLP